MRISDKERHEIAEKLREQAAFSSLTLTEWWDRLQLTVTGHVYITAPEKTYFAIADLIDRPTCAIVESYMGDNLESVEEMPHHVLSYGHIAYGEDDPMFCPVCGAAVTDDYR